MLDLPGMEDLRLRFVRDGQAELALGVGEHGIGRAGDVGGGLVADATRPTVRFFVDRRGVWLNVAEGMRGVHVNGRQVRRMAMLRLGDTIHIDGDEIRLIGARPPLVPTARLRDMVAETHGDPRVVLRGVGGQYHGRSFTLEQPRLVGRCDDADIRIDALAFADRHARIELIGEHIVLRDLGSVDGSVVNGEAVRDALLLPGDQIVFDAHHRFVVEAPAPAARAAAGSAEDAGGGDAAARANASSSRRSPWRLPILLLAALLLAGLLAALLLFGSA